MTGHFAYFVVRSMRNRLMRQSRRLKSPRYAIAALVGVLYFYFLFGSSIRSDANGAMADTWITIGRLAGPLMLAFLASWWWLWGGHRHGLILTPAETHLLLPAPLTRGEVIRFKIMQAQPALLFSAIIGTIVMRGTGLPWPLQLLSVWVLVATLHQHQIAASLVHAAADQHGRSGLRRNIVPVVLFGIAFMVLIWAVLGAVPDLRASGSPGEALERLTALLSEPAPRIVLTPFRILLAPTLATSAAAWLLPFAGACVVLVIHYAWVVRTDAAFEESAAEEGQRRDALVAAVRSGGMSRMNFIRRRHGRKIAKAWLPLRPGGRAAYAILWKNVLYAQRSVRSAPRFMGIALVVIVIMALNDGGSAGGDLVGFGALICLGVAGTLTFFGPFVIRNDLRMDLKHIEQLRTFPVRGRDLVGAEIGAATLTLTVPQIVLTMIGLLLFMTNGAITLLETLLIMGCAIVVLPVVNGLAISIQNMLALLYPSWVRLGEQDAGGIESVGQNMIVMVGTLVLLLLLAAPPAIAGALVGAPLAMLIGESAIAVAVMAAVIAAAAEMVLLVNWLGGLYERTDPVAAGLLR